MFFSEWLFPTASAPVATTRVPHVDVGACGLGSVAVVARAGVLDLVVEEIAVGAPHEADDEATVADGHALALLHEPLRDLKWLALLDDGDGAPGREHVRGV